MPLSGTVSVSTINDIARKASFASLHADNPVV
jgi:hypothetical protein